MFISKYNMSGVFSLNYIKANFCSLTETLLCTKLDNQHIAIIIEKDILDRGLPRPQITLERQKNISWTKQVMNMQMGKPYRTKEEERITRNIRWLSEGELHGNMRFEVYRCLYI